MAQVIIEHPDGRRYEVSEQAFKDLYEPFGFAVQGLYYNGTVLPDTEANRKKAETDTADPLVAENAARTVILSDLEAEARAKLVKESADKPAKTPKAES